MCNCGNKRAEYRKSILPAGSVPTPAAPESNQLKIKFKYTGYSSLTVIGSGSGHPYYFKNHGDVQEVSSNDTMFMMTLPGVERV